jgi:hypothetical protein
MVDAIPTVPWRFGEVYLATDFVMAKNIAIQNQANLLFKGPGDAFVKEVAKWIRDSFYYPLDNSDNPSASGQLLRHQKGVLSGYWFKNCVYYAWSLPNEVLGATKCGICIDTANLAASVFRAKEVEGAWCTIGDVLAVSDNSLLGRHAWVEVPYHGGTFVLETTIHSEGANNLVAAVEVYDRNSEWAKRAGLYFAVQAKYNEKEFLGEGPLGAQAIELMGYPAGMMQRYGLEATCRRSGRSLHRAWRKEELKKEKLVQKAWR